MKFGMINGYKPECFDYVKGKGLDFIEICRNNDEEALDFIAQADSVKECVKRTGITVQSVGRWNSLPNDKGKINPEVIDLNFKLIDAAAKVGASVFVCGCNYDDSISLYKNYTLAIEYFGRVTEYATKYGITTAVYNCDWNNFVHSDREWQVVHGELPELMIKYDCSHAYYRKHDYLKELAMWADRVAHIHIKGANIIDGVRYDDPPAGMDRIDWNSVFSIIYKSGYNAGLSLEPHSRVWSGELREPGVDYAIRFIRPYILR